MRLFNLLLSIFVLATASTLAGAEPYRDFEKQARDAYGSYRLALFATNTGDREKSIAAIGKFSTQWGTLAGKWSKTPPPQYSEDKQFLADLKKIAETSDKALAQAKPGDLKKAHVTLEAIRDMLAELRRRNGIVSYSDHINAYHSHMEHMLQVSYAGKHFELIADAGVLAYLHSRLAKEAPADIRAKPEFKRALSGVGASVQNLRSAIVMNDRQKIGQALKELKRPYAMLFLFWG